MLGVSVVFENLVDVEVITQESLSLKYYHIY